MHHDQAIGLFGLSQWTFEADTNVFDLHGLRRQTQRMIADNNLGQQPLRALNPQMTGEANFGHAVRPRFIQDDQAVSGEIGKRSAMIERRR